MEHGSLLLLLLLLLVFPPFFVDLFLRKFMKSLNKAAATQGNREEN